MNSEGISRAIVYGTAADTACEGNDVRLEGTGSAGFPNRTDSAISLSGSTFTITGTNFVIWPTLTTKMLKSTQSIAITNVVGLHWIYYDAAGVLTCAPPASGFPGLDKCLVANVYWDGAKALFLGDERHDNVMDTATHAYLHNNIGARYTSGFTLVKLSALIDGALPASAQVVVDGGSFADEDIAITVSRGSAGVAFTQELGLVSGAVPAQIPVYYRTGADGHWTKDVATTYPIKPSGAAGTRVGYNKDTAGTWSVADPIVNGAIVAYWIVATNDRYEPVIAIMGQRFDATGNTAAILLAAQTNNTFAALSQGGLPFAEMKVLYRLLVKTDTNYNNAIKGAIQVLTASDDYRSVASIPSGNYVASAHNSLAGRSDPNQHPATAISLDVSNFTGALRTADDTVQLAMNRLSKNNAEGGRWWKIEGTPTASGGWAILSSGLSDFYPRLGQPIKLFSSLGVVCEKSTGTYVTSVASLTGVNSTMLTTPRKALWFQLVASGGLHIEIYGTELGSSDATPVLLGHTGTIASTTTYAVTADNTSGLAGNISVTYNAVYTDGSKTVVEFFRHNIISSITSTTITFKGQECAAPTEVWLGSPDCVRVIDMSIAGNWAAPASQTAFSDKVFHMPRWLFGDGSIVYMQLKTRVADSGATQPIAGLTVNAASVTGATPTTTVTTSNTLFTEFPDAPLRHVKMGDTLDIWTVAGTVGDARDSLFEVVGVVY
jgi:hypothetical protein